jgi:hypothetical protein
LSCGEAGSDDLCLAGVGVIGEGNGGGGIAEGHSQIGGVFDVERVVAYSDKRQGEGIDRHDAFADVGVGDRDVTACGVDDQIVILIPTKIHDHGGQLLQQDVVGTIETESEDIIGIIATSKAQSLDPVDCEGLHDIGINQHLQGIFDHTQFKFDKASFADTHFRFIFIDDECDIISIAGVIGDADDSARVTEVVVNDIAVLKPDKATDDGICAVVINDDVLAANRYGANKSGGVNFEDSIDEVDLTVDDGAVVFSAGDDAINIDMIGASG